MVTRKIEFFAKPQEFLDLLNEIIIDMDLHAALAIGMKGEVIEMSEAYE